MMCIDYKEYGVCTAVSREIPIGENICEDCPCREEILEYQAFAHLVFDHDVKDGNIKKLRVTGNHELLEVELENWLGDE